MRVFKLVLLVLILAFLAAIAGAGWLALRPLPMKTSPAGFSVQSGASLRAVHHGHGEAVALQLPGGGHADNAGAQYTHMLGVFSG